ncbi:MAG: helix-turn-helix transcriptional regulator [Clostridia bacterium]|nr:helix-turn-helix transcriptional regulator [Clostridia bacterium]
MFYQPIVLSKGLYSVDTRHLACYELHWHSDLEIIYCQKGTFDVRIDGTDYHVTPGQTLFVGSAQPHEYYDCAEDNQITLLRVGSVFFGSALFMEIAKKQFGTAVIENNAEILNVFTRITELCNKKESLENKLEMQGCIYSLVSLLLKHLPRVSYRSAGQSKRITYILNIQKTLDHVSTNYDKEISVEKAAQIAGYEKNAFSRIFKQATDTSFHQYLNNYRIKKACILLLDNADTVSKIAENVGFQELKTFCRVFKQITGVTPSEYRKQQVKREE